MYGTAETASKNMAHSALNVGVEWKPVQEKQIGLLTAH